MKVIFIFILLAGCAMNDDSFLYKASIIELVATPTQYDKKKVVVYGYLTSGLATRLYLSKEHADYRDIKSSIYVDDITFEEEMTRKCSKNWVSINAKFELDDRGLSELNSIKRVYIIEKGKASKPCWKKAGEETKRGRSLE